MLVTAYANGLSIGTPPSRNDHERAKRGTITGWTPGAVRRHTRWLYSVEVERLNRDVGVAYTLTVRDLPPTAEEWTRLVKIWCDRMYAKGARRVHWVVEWQRPRRVDGVEGATQVPHLHAAVYWDARHEAHEGIAFGLVDWLAIAEPYGARWNAQDAKPIDGSEGWLAYLSKHAARGVRHYQRNGKPRGWETTGRLWGKRGDWPLADPLRMRVDEDGSYRMRRLVRAWRIADARAEYARAVAAPVPPTVRGASAHAARIQTARRRIASARRMLKKSNIERARTMGVSEWMRPDVAGPLLALLRRDGHRVGLADDYTEEEWKRPDTPTTRAQRSGKTPKRCRCGAPIAPSANPRPCHVEHQPRSRRSPVTPPRWSVTASPGSTAPTGSKPPGAPPAAGEPSSGAPLTAPPEAPTPD